MRARRAALPISRWTSIISSIWRPTVISGFSAVIGSWKIMAMRPPRTCRIRAALAASRSSPSKRIRPRTARTCGSGRSRMIARAATDFPDPDSPTRHRISPRPSVRENSETASGRSAQGGKATARSSILRSAGAASGTGSGRPQPRIEGVVEPLADEVDAEHGQKDREARDRAEPPGVAEEAPSGPYHEAPAHAVRIAKAEEGQRRLDQDGGRDHERAGDDDGR